MLITLHRPFLYTAVEYSTEPRLSVNFHMEHSVDKHKGSKKVQFQIKVVKQFFTALSRMVAESVRIARRSETSGNILLNSKGKGEYNRCKFPRLTIDGGGGWNEDKGSFPNPALNVGPDVVTRESNVCQRTMKSDISTVSTCTVGQTGSQSEIKYFPLFNSSPAQQMTVQKRKRGSTWAMIYFYQIDNNLCDVFRSHSYFNALIRDWDWNMSAVKKCLILWLVWSSFLFLPRLNLNHSWTVEDTYLPPS